MDIRYGVVFQPFEIEIPSDDVELVIREGITLRMIKGTSNLHFFIGNNQILDSHLLLSDHNSGTIKAQNEMLMSLGSIQLFGWMEGCPLSIIAASKGDERLAQLALNQLIIRSECLRENTNIYLRYHNDETKSFCNWGRAFTWYLLGQIKTIETLEDMSHLTLIEESYRYICEDFYEVAAIALKAATKEGVWTCFIDDPSIAIDTSASAGIALALAKGYKNGLYAQLYCTFKKCKSEENR